MPDLSNLPTRDKDGHLRAVVEVPRGARVKLKYEPADGVFVFSRPLVLGVHYPYDWGFFPSTRADDGDPLDVMIYHDARTWPGVVIPCRPVGVVRLTQTGDGKRRERNDRIIAVPVDEPRLDDARDLPERVREELEQFFLSAVFFQEKGAKVEGWQGPSSAEKLVREAQAAYDDGPSKAEGKGKPSGPKAR